MSKQQAKVESSKVRREVREERDKLNFGVGASGVQRVAKYWKQVEWRRKRQNLKKILSAKIKLKKCL